MKELVILNNLSNKMNEVKNLGYSPLFIALKGSQNYEMDNKNSDIDAICFVIPSIEDLFYKREVSITHKCENNELIDIKDIRLLVELLKKANPSYLEILFSKYVVAFNKEGEELVKYLQENRENFAAANKTKLLKTCVGAINSKIKNLYHDSPARAENIKNYGYCLKEIHHAFRLNILLKEYFENGKSFEESLVPQEPYKTFLLILKEIPQSLDKIAEIEKNVTKSVDKIYKEFKDVDFPFNEELFEELVNKIFYLVK